ncbi:MAG TPA: FkbM family methyltransferase [Pseudolabrys sp.]|nr:FkbM family methyltransferase [Pseudolabrys sp.]
MVREFFGARPGYFVEVGANEPRKESQSWHLEQAGWIGVLIEPQPDLAETLRRERRAKVFAVACSRPEQAGRSMRLYVAGAFSSFDADLAVTGVKAASAIDVPVRTLDDVLAEAQAPRPLDFLSIDVEGHEIDVLGGFDFACWKPRLILLEDHVVDLSKHRFMQAHGYRLIRRTGLNGWYVPREVAAPLGALGRWQILRKYYLALPFRMLREAKRRLRDRRRGLSNGQR